MKFKGQEITKELLKKAQQCKSGQELLKLAEENGIELSLEEAEALLDEYADVELDEAILDAANGGIDDTACSHHINKCSKYTKDGIKYISYG